MHLRVAPLAGAWIEMPTHTPTLRNIYVAPLAGAWIEIGSKAIEDKIKASSLPLRERGLKSDFTNMLFRNKCRSPCGSVD